MNDRARLLWSFLVSAALNLAVWTSLTFSAQGAVRVLWPAGNRETVVVSSVPVRIERRSISHVQRPAKSPPIHSEAQAGPDTGAITLELPDESSLDQAHPAVLSLPRNWSKTDFEVMGRTATTMWLEETKRGARFVPRVFLAQMNATPQYMSRPSLEPIVAQIVGVLRAQGADLRASSAVQLCGGARNGWFLSYVRPDTDPPLHVDATFLLTGETVSRAIYVRGVDQVEDSRARDALKTLCD